MNKTIDIGASLKRLFALEDKLAVVASSGGTAADEIAEMLAAAGAQVVIADQADHGHTLAERIAAAGGKALAIATDVEDEASVRALFASVLEAHGRVDILVNCGGLLVNQPFADLTIEEWECSYSVNVRSAFLCMREALKPMLANGGGRIVNVTTMGSQHPVLNGNAAYSSARAALNMLAKNVALDHARDGILVNTVLPGAVNGKVRIDNRTLAAMQAGRARTGPMAAEGRLPLGYGSAEDVAAAVLYLVGPSGGYITGQTLVLDGGFLLT